MITLQFWRGYDKECLISVAEKKSYKIVELGYPLLSFISDLEISYYEFGKESLRIILKERWIVNVQDIQNDSISLDKNAAANSFDANKQSRLFTSQITMLV